jgi:phage repressor protein C with HTH and peptisase S24 domain
MNENPKKRALSDEALRECAALNAIYKAKKKELGVTQELIAIEGLKANSQSAASHYLTGRNALNAEAAAVFAKYLQVPIQDFSPRLAKEIASMAKSVSELRAVGERIGSYSVGETRPEANAELIGTMSAWDSKTPLGDDEVAIPLYKEVELAAGGGATEVIEVPGRLLRFAKSTLREAGVQEANAVCATIKGHSMERLIMDGATIGIDTGSKHIEDGEIYAFDQDGMLRVKYLYRLPGGGVRVRSENSDEFPDETLTSEQFANIRMLGWVFWWSTVRRRRGLSIAK